MDNELFLKRLSEVCEWHRQATGPNGKISMNKRKPKLLTEEELEELSEEELEEYLSLIEDRPNPTLAPTVKRIFPIVKRCEDCDQVVADRKVTYKFCKTNGPHFRSQCSACGLHRDPRTGEYTMRSYESQAIWQAFNRGRGAYESKYQAKKTLETK